MVAYGKRKEISFLLDTKALGIISANRPDLLRSWQMLALTLRTPYWIGHSRGSAVDFAVQYSTRTRTSTIQPVLAAVAIDEMND